MVTRKLYLSLWFLLSYTRYCTALQNDDNAYSKIHTSNEVIKSVLTSDEAPFKQLMKQVSVMQSENRRLLERVDRLESENRQWFERLSDGESENKELLERLVGLESDNRQLHERQQRLESDDILYKKEIHWLKTELMIQRGHTDNMETMIKAQQAEIDELKHITQTSDKSSNTSLSTCIQESLNNKEMKPILSRDPDASQEHVKPKIRRSVVDMQVAFFASLSNHQTRIGHLQNVVFDHVKTNIGNGYDPNVGLFRAPENGTYVFSTTLMTYYNNTSNYGIYLNRQMVTTIYLGGHQKNYDSASETVVLTLNKGDDISVKHRNADKDLHGYSACIFSGFLLYQDENIEPVFLGK